MSETKKCEWCGAEFVGKTERKRFCRRKCNADKNNTERTIRDSAARKEKRENLKCRWCKKKITTTRIDTKLCGQECRNEEHLARLREETKENLTARPCKRCKKEFVPKRFSDTQFCSEKCIQSQWYLDNAEDLRPRNAQYRKEHAEEIRQWKAQDYDDPSSPRSFLTVAQRTREHIAKLRQDPKRHAQHLAKRAERERRARQRKKKLALRAAYFADPNNAVRVESRNQMSPEQRAADDKKLDRLLESRDRKEIRDARKRELDAVKLAAELAATARHDPVWADMEWSPEPGTK